MKIVDGNTPTIVGARIGENILIKLTDGSTKRLIFSEIKSVGLEGYNRDQLNNPLKFYPFANILEVSKDD